MPTPKFDLLSNVNKDDTVDSWKTSMLCADFSDACSGVIYLVKDRLIKII
jgi:hypothetical protein